MVASEDSDLNEGKSFQLRNAGLSVAQKNSLMVTIVAFSSLF